MIEKKTYNKLILLLPFLAILFLNHFLFAQNKIIKKFQLPKNIYNKNNKIIPKYKNFTPQIGLTLSGGGARGIAHIGVLKVLMENNIPIEFITGTSMGSIVGGLFASGYTVEEIWNFAESVNWSEIIQDQPPRKNLFLSQKQIKNRQFLSLRIKNLKPIIPSAISPGQKLYSILSNFILGAPFHTIKNYDDLEIKFRSLATDLITGKKIVFDKGDLAQIMLSSSAIPLLFSPVEIDSLLLVDGGVLENIPVEILQNKNLDILIAVDTTSPLRPKDEILYPWQLADQVTTIMQNNQKSESRKNVDILITPYFYKRTNTDFDSMEVAFHAGINATEKLLPNIFEKIKSSKNKLYDSKNKEWQIYSVNLSSSIKEILEINNFNDHLWSEKKIYKNLEKLNKAGSFYDIQVLLIENIDSTLFLNFEVKSYPIIKKIIINHHNLLSDSLILSNIYNKVGKTFNINNWQKDRKKILKLYRKNDFAEARIKKEKIDLETGVLEIEIDEGKIASIKLVGNKKTKPLIVLREYPLKKGDYLYKSLAHQGFDNIYSLGYFDRVQVEYKWKNDSLHVIINVVEKQSTLLQFSYNYSRDDRLQTNLQWLNDNIFGFGNRLILSNIIGKRRYSGNIQLQSDRLFRTYISSSINAFYFKQKHYTYEEGEIFGEYQERRSGIHASIGQQLKRAGLVSLQLRLEQITLNSVFGSGYPIVNTNNTSLRLESIVDSFDKLPFPTKGRYHHFYYEMSNDVLGNNVSFFKIYSSLEYYFTFFRRWTVHPRLVWATADLTTPFQEMYILGGENSFYGYRLDEKRGRRLFKTRLELRYFLTKKLPFDTYFSFGYDFGSIWKNSLQEINLEDFVHGFGTTLSINSILGVYSFSYGKNSDNRKEYYFNLGFNF